MTVYMRNLGDVRKGFPISNLKDEVEDIKGILIKNLIIKSGITVQMKTMHQKFNKLKYFGISSSSLNDRSYVILLKALSYCTTELKLLSFRHCNLTELMITSIYALVKSKEADKKPINLQIYTVYDRDVTNLPYRFGYILSLLGKHCRDVFHTQPDKTTSDLWMKHFFTAAEIAKRKNPPSLVSLGTLHLEASGPEVYKDVWKFFDTKNNPKSWTANVVDYNKDFLEEKKFL